MLWLDRPGDTDAILMPELQFNNLCLIQLSFPVQSKDDDNFFLW
jgi:hypothetical protein